MIIGENKTLITKEELKRLKRALKDKNENKILDWAREFECQVEQKYTRIYKEELDMAVDNFILTIVYTLRYNECTNFGGKRIDSFMKDLLIKWIMRQTNGHLRLFTNTRENFRPFRVDLDTRKLQIIIAHIL